MQKEINKQDLNKLKFMAPLGNLIFMSWLYFDQIFIDPSMWNYCLFIRIVLPIIFIPLYFLPKDILIPKAHLIFSANFGIGFGSLLPLMLYTKYTEFYLICSFLIPLMGSLINTYHVKFFSVYLISFIAFSALCYNKIMTLDFQTQMFIYFYGCTSIIMCAFIVHYNYKNRVYRHHLQTQIKESLEDKSSLVRILTHDISNVLTVLGMNYSIIKMFHNKIESSDQVKRCVDIVDRSAISLGEIIQKVKEMESIDGGKKELELSPHNLLELINVTTDFLQDQFSKKQVELKVVANNLDWIEIDIDPTIFRYNVLSNLLTNALKFSQPNSKVVVSLEKQNQFAIITVQDFGIGIPTYLHDSIFDPSKKSTRKGTSGEEGTGFGMPLAYSCTTKMKGSLRFESKDMSESPDDHGTTFFICFLISKHSITNLAA